MIDIEKKVKGGNQDHVGLKIGYNQFYKDAANCLKGMLNWKFLENSHPNHVFDTVNYIHSKHCAF